MKRSLFKKGELSTAMTTVFSDRNVDFETKFSRGRDSRQAVKSSLFYQRTLYLIFSSCLLLFRIFFREIWLLKNLVIFISDRTRENMLAGFRLAPGAARIQA